MRFTTRREIGRTRESTHEKAAKKEKKRRKENQRKIESEALLLAPSHVEGLTVDGALRYLTRATVKATRLPPA